MYSCMQCRAGALVGTQECCGSPRPTSGAILRSHPLVFEVGQALIGQEHAFLRGIELCLRACRCMLYPLSHFPSLGMKSYTLTVVIFAALCYQGVS